MSEQEGLQVKIICGICKGRSGVANINSVNNGKVKVTFGNMSVGYVPLYCIEGYKQFSDMRTKIIKLQRVLIRENMEANFNSHKLANPALHRMWHKEQFGQYPGE